MNSIAQHDALQHTANLIVDRAIKLAGLTAPMDGLGMARTCAVSNVAAQLADKPVPEAAIVLSFDPASMPLYYTIMQHAEPARQALSQEITKGARTA